MPYEAFVKIFPDIAQAETRSITILNETDYGVPADEYALLELFCNEKKCDCRRVMFSVLSKNRQALVAVVAYGWETEAYYAKWFGSRDRTTIRELIGPILNPGSPRSDIAEGILKMIRDIVIPDTAYMDRIRKHYRMVRDKVDHPIQLARRGRKIIRKR